MPGSSQRPAEEARELTALLREVTRAEPVMWGDSIVGFGRYHYRYASGREGDWFLTGFSPRKRNLAICVMAGFDAFGDLLDRLGKHRTGASCLYLKRLSDADPEILRELLSRPVQHVIATNPPG